MGRGRAARSPVFRPARGGGERTVLRPGLPRAIVLLGGAGGFVEGVHAAISAPNDSTPTATATTAATAAATTASPAATSVILSFDLLHHFLELLEFGAPVVVIGRDWGE